MVCSHATTAPKIPPSASTPLRRSADHPRAAILGAVEGKRWTSLHRKSRHHLLPPPLPPSTKLPHPQSSPNQHLATLALASAPFPRNPHTTLRQNEPILPDPPLCLQTENLRRFNSPRPRPGQDLLQMLDSTRMNDLPPLRVLLTNLTRHHGPDRPVGYLHPRLLRPPEDLLISCITQ